MKSHQQHHGGVSSHSLFAFLLVVTITLCLVEESRGQIQRFTTPVSVTERNPETSETIRSFDTTIHYDNEGGNETFRLETVLPALNGSVFELNIYEDRFIRFSWCEDNCGWEDLFGQTLPRFWCPSSGGDPVTGAPVNGVPASDLVQHTSGDVTMWCRAADLEPVAARWNRTPTLESHYAFAFPVSTSFAPAVLEAPDFCPEVDSSCFRLDLVIVLDHSGSITRDWWDQVEFVLDLVSEFSISEKAFKVSVISYAGTQDCLEGILTTTVISPLTANKEALLASVRDAQNVPPQVSSTFNCVNGTGHFTATVKGIHSAFDQLEELGRPATKRAVIVVTDGSGNRPRVPFDTALSAPGSCEGEEWITAADGLSSPDNGHDDWLCYMYQCRFEDAGALIYAVGVGSVPVPSINRIAANSGTDCDGISDGEGDLSELQERAILLSGFDALGDVAFDLSRQLLCPSASQSPCENSCRPGGFCCGGQCVCAQDCSTVGDECQTGECATTSLGTFCIALGSPCSSSDDQTPAIVGGVIGGFLALGCLLLTLLSIILLSVFFVHKARHDVQAFESAFTQGNDVVSSPLFEEKFASQSSPLYEMDS